MPDAFGNPTPQELMAARRKQQQTSFARALQSGSKGAQAGAALAAIFNAPAQAREAKAEQAQAAQVQNTMGEGQRFFNQLDESIPYEKRVGLMYMHTAQQLQQLGLQGPAQAMLQQGQGILAEVDNRERANTTQQERDRQAQRDRLALADAQAGHRAAEAQRSHERGLEKLQIQQEFAAGEQDERLASSLQIARERNAASAAGVTYKESQWKAANFANRMEQQEKVLQQFGDTFAGTAAIGGALPSAMQFGDRQQWETAKLGWTMAVLRKESGATITPQEIESTDQTYFPQRGDSAEVIEQKRELRMAAQAGMQAESGGAYDLVQEEYRTQSEEAARRRQEKKSTIKGAGTADDPIVL